ncbi:N-acetylmuramoyl-L-alanine amidase [Bartonella sp. DGB1]|uniref:N-acetylmuramoyl-L-alanine amidase family protein n=1 Tax=Bartonella sp. DGB1 TaxID=3239807 RepID=UPI003525E32F
MLNFLYKKNIYLAILSMFFLLCSNYISVAESKNFIVVIDPGHGGIDSGAIGKNGTLEKNVTLNFAKRLHEKLKKYQDIKTYLTRNSDIFINLTDRMNIARDLGADLFISIHADTIDIKNIRGITIYTSSKISSDLISQKLSETQNQVNFLLGIPPSYNTVVPSILLELTRRENQQKSIKIAHTIIKNIKKNFLLNNNPHRQANFQVLSAPDFPSILLELGYLSNEEDKKLLNNDEWLNKLAESLADAIASFKK